MGYGSAAEPMDKGTEQSSIIQRVLALYSRGQFPMGEPGTRDIYLHDPDPRAIIPLDRRFHVPATLGQRVRSGRFEIRTDTAFVEVLRGCARPRPGKEGGESTWITGDIASIYLELHRAGHAHSVEAWLPIGGAPKQPTAGAWRLVGGLYGVHLNGLFAGESMFSSPELGGTDASKVCLVHLVGHLRERGFGLLDTQFLTPHLARFGAVEIRRSEYRARLREAMKARTTWLPFDPRAGLAGLAGETAAPPPPP